MSTAATLPIPNQSHFRILAIDPSINSLGWAIFSASLGRIKLVRSGTVTAPDAVRTHMLEARIQWMMQQVKDIYDYAAIEYVMIEKPQLWGAYKSVASQHSGDLLGLYLTVGALFGMFTAIHIETLLIEVNKWKGQLPKEVTQERMELKYKTKFDTNDESDAVGIGDYFMVNHDALLQEYADMELFLHNC